MSALLFKMKPEVLMDSSRRSLNETAIHLRLIADALTKPDLTLADARKVLSEEIPPLRIKMAVAINEWDKALKQREELRDKMDFFAQRTGERREEAA